MKLFMFTVYDDKAKAYITPFFRPETGMALRDFSDCVNDPLHAFGRNPSDYTLFGVGAFDSSTGEIVKSEPMLTVANGVQVKRAPELSEVPVGQKSNGAYREALERRLDEQEAV